MYSTLNLYGQSCSTNNQHFPCPSIPLPTYHVDDDIRTPPQTPHEESIHITKVKFDLEPKIMSNERKVTMLGKDGNLLPVMDPRFNLREICKQCVLLEDHLTHDDKRCTDCCTKHFLALEGLAEECLTLDKQGILTDDVKTLPRKIRELQLMWIKNPSPSKCTEISQKLREIRKQFQEQTFPIIENGCHGNVCKVKV